MRGRTKKNALSGHLGDYAKLKQEIHVIHNALVQQQLGNSIPSATEVEPLRKRKTSTGQEEAMRKRRTNAKQPSSVWAAVDRSNRLFNYGASAEKVTATTGTGGKSLPKLSSEKNERAQGQC